MRIVWLSIGRHLHTERWIQWFAERGHECHLLTVQPGPIDGVTVHDIRRGGKGKPLRYWRSLGEVKRLLAEIQPDILNTHFLTGYGYWGDFSGYHPNVLSVWGDDVYVTPHENALKLWLAKRALRHADAITGDSLDILKDCVKLGADAANCHEILWGIDPSQFHPDRKTDLRLRLGIPEDAPLLFSPRSFTQPYYNLEIIIEAFSRLQKESPEAHFIFAGYEGDQSPFMERAAAAGLGGEGVHFVGRIPHAEFANYLVASDIFVSVPSVDATAVSLLEAMSSGTAVVVSSLPSSTEWVEDGHSGRVVPPRDADALLDALRDLAGDADTRRRMGEAARTRVEIQADHHRNMLQAEQLYLSLLGQKHDASLLRPLNRLLA